MAEAPSPSARETAARALLDQPATSMPSKPATGTDTLTIGCKMPNGLRLRLHYEEDYDEPMFGGGTKRTKRFVPVPDSDLILRGPARVTSMLPLEQAETFAPGGYVLTHGVPRDWWEQWMKYNKDSAIVRNRIVFAADSGERATAQAREQREVQSGLQPVDPNNIRGRIPRGPTEPLIETAEGAGVLGKKDS